MDRRDNDTTKIWLNPNQCDLLWRFFHSDAVVQLCRATVLRTLLNGGLEIARGGKNKATRRSSTKQFRDVIRHFWVPFVVDLYDSMMIWGLCVWTTRMATVPGSSRPVEVPYVVPYGAYRLQLIRGEHGELEYAVFRVARTTLMASDTDADPTMKVVQSRFYRPSLEGHVRSPLLPLLPLYRFSKEMHDYAVQVEQIRANPPLICETRPDKPTNTEAVALEMFGDAECFADEAQATYARNRQNMNAFNRQKNMAAVLNGKFPRDRETYIDPFTGQVHTKKRKRQIWEDNVFVLPDGQTMCPVLRPDTRGDLLEMEQHRIDMTCAAFGVPKSTVLQDRTSSAMRANMAGADMAQRMFMRAMDSIGEDIAQHLRGVYIEMYGADDAVEITFPFLPVLDVEEMLLMGELGFVSRTTLAKRLLATVGLPPSDLALQGKAQMDIMTRPENKQKEPAQPAAKKAKKK